MATTNAAQGLRSPATVAKKITGWYIASAVVLILLGIFGIIEPGVAGLGVTLLVGWLLVIGAVLHFIAAFKGGGAKQVIFQILIGLVYLVGGGYFLTHTIMGVATLTLLLAGIILAEGVIEVVSYFRMRNEGASSWLLINGIITILLGGLLLVFPGIGLISLTYLLIAFFVAEGIVTIMYALEHRRELTRRWGWMLLSGVVDLFVAFVILIGLPGSFAWALGLLVGVNLLFGGASMIAMALAARSD